MSYPKEINRIYLRNRYRKQREEFISMLGGRCAKCDATDNLHIDHIDPLTKSFPIARLWSKQDLPKVHRELKKCQLLCEAHHIIKTVSETRGVEKGWRHGTQYGWMQKKCRCLACLAAKYRHNRNRNEKRRKPGGYGPRAKI